MTSRIKINKKLPSYLKRTSKGGLLTGFIYVLTFMSILFLSIWQTFEFENNKTNMDLVDQRISVIEEQINIVDETNNDSMTDITSSIQFLDKEIRKLWDLSNKRNRKNISQNLNSIENLNEKIESIDKKDEVLSAQQRALTLELARIKNIQDNINSQLDNFDDITPNETGSDSLADIEESIDSFNAYRVQVNQSLLDLRKQLNDLELALSQAENE